MSKKNPPTSQQVENIRDFLDNPTNKNTLKQYSFRIKDLTLAMGITYSRALAYLIAGELRAKGYVKYFSSNLGEVFRHSSTCTPSKTGKRLSKLKHLHTDLHKLNWWVD